MVSLRLSGLWATHSRSTMSQFVCFFPWQHWVPNPQAQEDENYRGRLTLKKEPIPTEGFLLNHNKQTSRSSALQCFNIVLKMPICVCEPCSMRLYMCDWTPSCKATIKVACTPVKSKEIKLFIKSTFLPLIQILKKQTSVEHDIHSLQYLHPRTWLPFILIKVNT